MKTEEVRNCINCIYFSWSEAAMDCFYPDCEFGIGISDPYEITDCHSWVLED